LLLVTLCSILVFFSSNPSAATISLPLIALPCLVCLASQKKKEREKHNRVRDFWSRLSRADAPTFSFFVSDHTSLSTGCVFLLASLKQTKK